MNIIENEEEEEKKEEQEKTQPIWKTYVLCDSNCTALWKRQNYGDSGFLELVEEELKRLSTGLLDHC